MNELLLSLVQELKNYTQLFNVLKKKERKKLNKEQILRYKQIKKALILIKKLEKKRQLDFNVLAVTNLKPDIFLGDGLGDFLDREEELFFKIEKEQRNIFFPALNLKANENLAVFQEIISELDEIQSLIPKALIVEEEEMNKNLEENLNFPKIYKKIKISNEKTLEEYNKRIEIDKRRYLKYSKSISRQLIAQEEIANSFSTNDSGDLMLDLGKPSLPTNLEGRATYEIFDLPLFEGNEDDFCSIASNDVVQKQDGNCTLIAALMQIAAKEPQLIKDAIVVKGQTKNSKKQIISNYAVTLYLPQKETTGKKVKVVVSNEFYSLGNGKPFFTGKGDNELWVLLIEKAVASLLGGYSIFEKDGYSINAILSVLTGQPSPQIILIDEEMDVKKLKNWFIANQDKVITVADTEHAYSVTNINIEEDLITLTEPMSLKIFNYSIKAIKKGFAKVAACSLTKGVECPDDMQNPNAKPIKTTNSFLKMSLEDQLLLLGEKSIKWKNYKGDICIVKKIDDSIIVLEVNSIEEEIYIEDLGDWILQAIIPLSDIETIIKKVNVKWINKDGEEYMFSSFYNGLIEFESTKGMVELTKEEVYQIFGIVTK